MRQPSKTAMTVAEEILDHVNYGLSRADIVREWAEVIDERNLPLVEAVSELLESAELNHGVPDSHCVNRLRDVLVDFQAGSASHPSRFQGAAQD